jgi:hypothetical protein
VCDEHEFLAARWLGRLDFPPEIVLREFIRELVERPEPERQAYARRFVAVMMGPRVEYHTAQRLLASAGNAPVPLARLELEADTGFIALRARRDELLKQLDARTSESELPALLQKRDELRRQVEEKKTMESRLRQTIAATS